MRLGAAYSTQGADRIVNPQTSFPVAGFRYDMPAEEVILWCKDALRPSRGSLWTRTHKGKEPA